MTRVFIPTLAAAGACLAAACTTTGTHQIAKADAAAVLQTAQADPYPVIYDTGRVSAAWGDRWTAGNLFERALDKTAPSDDKLTVQARFNLANKYEQTGRLPQAVALYSAVARDGRFLWGITDPDYRNPEARLTTINLGDEAARRLALIEQRLAYAQGPGAPSAVAAGVPTAAVTGVPIAPNGRVSDAEAQRLDDLAQGASQ